MNDQQVAYGWAPLTDDTDCDGCHITLRADDPDGIYTVEGKVYCTLACNRDNLTRYSHQFLIAVTVESVAKDPDKVALRELLEALSRRTGDILEHDKREAFGHQDTEEL